MFYATSIFCKNIWYSDDTAGPEASAGAQLGRTNPSADVEGWSESIRSILQTKECIRDWDYYSPTPLPPPPHPRKFLVNPTHVRKSINFDLL
jgi:hypothetical protein